MISELRIKEELEIQLRIRKRLLDSVFSEYVKLQIIKNNVYIETLKWVLEID